MLELCECVLSDIDIRAACKHLNSTVDLIHNALEIFRCLNDQTLAGVGGQMNYDGRRMVKGGELDCSSLGRTAEAGDVVHDALDKGMSGVPETRIDPPLSPSAFCLALLLPRGGKANACILQRQCGVMMLALSV